jgi:hypothetical protein
MATSRVRKLNRQYGLIFYAPSIQIHSINSAHASHHRLRVDVGF